MSSDLRSVWRAKSNDEVSAAAAVYWEFVEEAQAALTDEIARRGLPVATARPGGSIGDDVFSSVAHASVRLIDVSAQASDGRWISAGSGVAYLLGFMIVVVSASQLLLGRPNLDVESFYRAMIAGLAAGIVLLATGWGLSRRKRWAGAAAILIGLAPVVASALTVFWRQPEGAGLGALVLVAVLSWAAFINPAVRLARHLKRTRRTRFDERRRRPVQAKPFQVWRRWRSYAPYLAAMVGLPFAYLVIAALLGLRPTAWILVPPEFFLYYLARRNATMSAAQVLSYTDEKPVLFLRSFGDDNIRFRRVFGAWTSVEEDVTLALAYAGPVIAIGRPGERLRPLGAARETVPNEEWQSKVSDYIARSQLVVLMIGTTQGLDWEVRRVVELGALDKLILVIPPLTPREVAERWIATVGGSRAFDGVTAETITSDALLVRRGLDGEVLVATSRHRKAGDYLEATRAMLLLG